MIFHRVVGAFTNFIIPQKKLSSPCRSLCMTSYQSPWHDPSLARKPALLLPSFKCGELGPLWRAEEIPSVGYKFRAGWLPSLDSWMYEIPVSKSIQTMHWILISKARKTPSLKAYNSGSVIMHTPSFLPSDWTSCTMHLWITHLYQRHLALATFLSDFIVRDHL